MCVVASSVIHRLRRVGFRCSPLRYCQESIKQCFGSYTECEAKFVAKIEISLLKILLLRQKHVVFDIDWDSSVTGDYIKEKGIVSNRNH